MIGTPVRLFSSPRGHENLGLSLVVRGFAASVSSFHSYLNFTRSFLQDPLRYLAPNGRRQENQAQQIFEDSETLQTDIVDQFLPDDTVTSTTNSAPTDRQIINVKLVNHLQGRSVTAWCRSWRGTTGRMLAEIARALRLEVYESYSLEGTAEYVYGFVKMSFLAPLVLC